MAVMVLEIVSLLWSHPILTGLLILLFTTPLFHIVLFFTPLLMSTALCVIALISIGPQIEKIREERQFKLSLNARNVALERPVNRYIVIRQGRPQRPAMRLGGPGGRRWSDWVKGIEIHGNTVWLSESHIMRDIAEEGLKADFSHQDGGIPITSEDFRSKGAFTLDQISGSDDKTESPLDNPAEEHDLQLAEVKEEYAVQTLHAEASFAKQQDSDEDKSLDRAVVVSVGDDATRKEQPVSGNLNSDDFGGNWQDNNRYSELIPVESSSGPPGLSLFAQNETKFTLGAAASPVPKKKKKKKKTSWFRRRRIPCISKALGQLRERICNQLRRIFT